MCDAPIWIPKCDICKKIIYNDYFGGEWYWITTIYDANNGGSDWVGICKKCWDSHQEEVTTMKKNWSHYTLYNKKISIGKTQWIANGKECSFDEYKKIIYGK